MIHVGEVLDVEENCRCAPALLQPASLSTQGFSRLLALLVALLAVFFAVLSSILPGLALCCAARHPFFFLLLTRLCRPLRPPPPPAGGGEPEYVDNGSPVDNLQFVTNVQNVVTCE